MVVENKYKYLDVIRADPVEYVRRYGDVLKLAKDLPSFVNNIETPHGLVLAADQHHHFSQHSNVHELEGDLHALGLVDLEKEGLGEYRNFLGKMGVNFTK